MKTFRALIAASLALVLTVDPVMGSVGAGLVPARREIGFRSVRMSGPAQGRPLPISFEDQAVVPFPESFTFPGIYPQAQAKQHIPPGAPGRMEMSSPASDDRESAAKEKRLSARFRKNIADLTQFIKEIEVPLKSPPNFKFVAWQGDDAFRYEAAGDARPARILFNRNQLARLSDEQWQAVYEQAYEDNWYQDEALRHGDAIIRNGANPTHYGPGAFQDRVEFLIKIFNTLKMKDLSGQNAAEIGAGSGALSYVLARRGAHVVAVDASEEMKRQAEGHIAIKSTELGKPIAVNYRLDRFTNLSSLADGSFDLIVMQNTLYLLPPGMRKRVLARLLVKLKNHGRVILLEFDDQARRSGWLRQPLEELVGQPEVDVHFAVAARDPRDGRELLAVFIDKVSPLGAVGAWTWKLIGLKSVVWMGFWEALATTVGSVWTVSHRAAVTVPIPGQMLQNVYQLSLAALPVVIASAVILFVLHYYTGVAQADPSLEPVTRRFRLSVKATAIAMSSFLAVPFIALGLISSPAWFFLAAVIGVGLHPLLNWMTKHTPGAIPAGQNAFPMANSTLPRQALSESDPEAFARVKVAWEVIRDYTVIRDPLPERADGLFVFGSDLEWLPLAAVMIARRIPIVRAIFSGGIGRLTPPAWRGSSEGEVYTEVARRLGLDAKAEGKSRTTWQNALYSLNLMEADGLPINDLIVMQLPLAMRRAIGDVRQQLIEKFGDRGRTIRIHGWAPFVPSFEIVPAGWTRGEWEWRLFIEAYMEIPRYINYQKRGFVPVDPVPRKVIEAAIVLGEFFNDDHQKTLLPAEFYDSSLENNAVGALETLQRAWPSAPSAWQRKSPVKDSPAPRWDRMMRAWGPNPWRQFIARFVSWTYALYSRLEVREREILEQWSRLHVAARPAAYAEIRGLARGLGGPAHQDAESLHRIREAA